MEFSLNHMTAPRMDARGLLDLAARLNCTGVEFRNDLAGPLFDGQSPGAMARAAQDAGQRIFALAEVKAFNAFTDATRSAAEDVMQTAVACGAGAVALIARNDGQRLGETERRTDLAHALRELAPMLVHHGLIGLIEPLGFDTCNLRSKSELVDTIETLGLGAQFRLVHDTFHHHLAGESAIFAAQTGMVHISGVGDPTPDVAQMQDHHRGLIDANDRLDNIGQIAALLAGGYGGPFSFECFAPEIHALPNPQVALSRSIAFIETNVAQAVA